MKDEKQPVILRLIRKRNRAGSVAYRCLKRDEGSREPKALKSHGTQE
jgi:hypothetical protein